MANVYYANSAGALGTESGVDEENACTLSDALLNGAKLHSARSRSDTIYCKNGTTIQYEGAKYAGSVIEYGTAGAPAILEGYAVDPGDGGVVEAECIGETQHNFFETVNRPYWNIRNFKVTNALNAFMLYGARCNVDNCEFVNCNVGVYLRNSGGSFIRNTRLIGCSNGIYGGTVAYNTHLVNCEAYDCVNGFRLTIASAAYVNTLVGCIANNCTYGLQFAGPLLVVNSTFNNSAQYGVRFSGTAGGAVLINTLLTNSTVAGFSGTGFVLEDYNCGWYGNTTDVLGTLTKRYSIAPLSVDPSYKDDSPTAEADADLTPLNDAYKGVGAGLNAASATETYPDIGGIQVEPGAGGGGPKVWF